MLFDFLMCFLKHLQPLMEGSVWSSSEHIMSKEKKEFKIYWADSLIYPCIHLYGGILQFSSLRII